MIDPLPTVVARVDEIAASPVARKMRAVSLGSSNVWDAIRYEVADAVYDDVFREERRAAEPPRLNAISRTLWQGQFGQNYWANVLSTRLPVVTDLMAQTATLRARRLTRIDRPNDVLVAGALFRRSVVAAAPLLHELSRRYGIRYSVIAHDDPLLRHTREFHRAGLDCDPGAAYSLTGDRRAAGNVAATVRGILDTTRTKGPAWIPDAVSRRTLSPVAIRALVVHLRAAQRAIDHRRPRIVIIPDERQPLAHLVGHYAREKGIAVISAPLSRDQVIRKFPVDSSPLANRVFVFSPLAARFLRRRGAPADAVVAVNLADVDQGRDTDGAAANRAPNKRFLFASQAHARNATLLPWLDRAAAKNRDVSLVVRPHPSESAALVKLLRPRLAVSRKGSPDAAIIASDALLTHSSYMAIDAALKSRAVALLSHDGIPPMLPLISEGIATWCDSESTLGSFIESVASGRASIGPAQARFQQEQTTVPGVDRAAEIVIGFAR